MNIQMEFEKQFTDAMMRKLDRDIIGGYIERAMIEKSIND